MGTVPVMASGPLSVNATSPCPGSEVQPSGTVTVILGAAGSATSATVPTPIPVGSGKHTNALGGMWSGSVVSIPGTGVPPLVVGCCVPDALVVVDMTGSPARRALPPVALTHPESTAIATRHAADLKGISVTRKSQRQFLFQVFVRPAGKVDGDLGDGPASERERRLVAAGPCRTA